MKNCHFLYLIFAFLLVIGCTKKNLNLNLKKNDSLSVYFEIANHDSVSYDVRMANAKKAYDIVMQQENDSMHRVNLFKVANRYFNMRNYDNYKKITDIVIQKSISANDSSSLAKAYVYLGDYYGNLHKYDTCFSYFKKAESIYIRQKDSKKLGKLYENFSTFYFLMNDYGSSEIMTIKALELLKNTDENLTIYDGYNSLAVIANINSRHQEALEYHAKALKILNENQFPKTLQLKAVTYNNIGVVYQFMDNQKKAIEYFKLSMQEKDHRLNHPLSYAKTLDNMALSKFYSADFNGIEELIKKAIEIKDSINATSGIIFSKNNLSEYYLEIKDTVNSLKQANEALALSKITKIPEDVFSSLRRVALSDPKTAVTNYEKFIKLKDSLHLVERNARNRIARVEFQTDEIILEKEEAIAQKWTIFWILISGFLFAMLLFAIKLQNSKQRELRLAKNQQYANEEIYRLILDQQIKFEEGRQKEKNRIAKELHDGIMNKLASIRLNLFILEKKNDATTIENSLKYISDIQNIEKEIRNIAHDLSEDIFTIKDDYVGLLHNLVADFKDHETTKLHLEIDKDINWDSIKAIIKMNSYRILQECINNIMKHADASRIVIEILKIGTAIEILIKDDGKGFDVTKHSDGIGLQNIQSRAEEMGATYKIKSNINEGTLIIIKILIA